MNDKSCENCVNCEKYGENKEKWACENYYYGVGMPYDVAPPNDEACPNWSDKPEDKDRANDELRYFVDHFWDDADD